MVAHWYAICFVPGGPGFKSRQGRELLLLLLYKARADGGQGLTCTMPVVLYHPCSAPSK